MSLIMCTESECIDKILEDYEKNVTSRKDYNIWATNKYLTVTKFFKNSKNSQLVYKAMNFISYLDPVSIADTGLRSEKNWDELFVWDRDDIKITLREEFDSEGKEYISIKSQLLEIKHTKQV